METTQYSFKKGLYKGLITMVTAFGVIAAFTGFADLSLWGLLETYLKPLLGSLTLGGLFTLTSNWLKVKMSLGKKRV